MNKFWFKLIDRSLKGNSKKTRLKRRKAYYNKTITVSISFTNKWIRCDIPKENIENQNLDFVPNRSALPFNKAINISYKERNANYAEIFHSSTLLDSCV